jgi:hypothetical protein
MSKTFTYNQLFLEIIDSTLNTKYRFDEHELDPELLLAELRANLLDLIMDFSTQNKIKIIQLAEYTARVNNHASRN